MDLSFSELMLALFGASLVLVALSLLLLRGSGPDSTNSMAKFFLIALRFAIGWHCFVEGMEKIHTPNWTSEGYLREASGPLAEYYRDFAGDRLRDKLTLGPNDTFSAALDREWRSDVDAFANHYGFNAEQRARAEEILKKQEAATLAYLKSAKETVAKVSAYPPELKLEMSMKERIAELDRLLDRVRAIELKFPTSDKDVLKDWKNAKADLAKWRGELKKSLDTQTNKLKSIEKDYKAKIKKNVDTLTAKIKKLAEGPESAKLKKEIEAEEAKLWTPLTELLTSEQQLLGPMPATLTKPMGDWQLLEWSDFAVKWALTILGGLLMIGLFLRLSSFATALLILSFYLAMPPLPGWPESPRLEGHYLLVNKTLIEVIALFALTFIPTGRWAGIDGLLHACCGKKPLLTSPQREQG